MFEVRLDREVIAKAVQNYISVGGYQEKFESAASSWQFSRDVAACIQHALADSGIVHVANVILMDSQPAMDGTETSIQFNQFYYDASTSSGGNSGSGG